MKQEIDAALRDVVLSGQFILGRHVKALEAELAAYAGAAYGVGVGSRRDALQKYLGDRAIATAVYYPLPLHLQEPNRGRAIGLPVSERAARTVLSLPLFPEMTEGDLKTVAATIREFFAEQ